MVHLHFNILLTRLDFLAPAHYSGKLLRMLELSGLQSLSVERVARRVELIEPQASQRRTQLFMNAEGGDRNTPRFTEVFQKSALGAIALF